LSSVKSGVIDSELRASAEDAASAEPPLRATVFGCGADTFAILSFPAGDTVWPGSLTAAEREVCRLLLAGASNAEIARQRGTAPRTVANQVAAILRKLG
jgi:DNA-binding NarL/FixJ family response regulator